MLRDLQFINLSVPFSRENHLIIFLSVSEHAKNKLKICLSEVGSYWLCSDYVRKYFDMRNCAFLSILCSFLTIMY